jgi:GH15 family glucan-1,4-alpha-glucosidase
MAKLEDYALLSNTHSAALVSRQGSVDWLCLPCFDSDACFAALLGTKQHGSWQVSPTSMVHAIKRRYLPGTMVLESEVSSGDGHYRLLDFMPFPQSRGRLVRIVEGLSGNVRLRSELRVKFGYGVSTPWYQTRGDGITALAGPDAVCIRSSVKHAVQGDCVVSSFSVAQGERATFDLTWFASHEQPPKAVDPEEELNTCEQAWRRWSDACTYDGPYRNLVRRSLITLKALTYSPTGAVMAAPTTSLPEQLGGVRNWDYRFCWLRDATLTLLALMDGGFHGEAVCFRDWLVRAVAGDSEDVQIMYGMSGERRLTELELPWLPGYEQSHPVRIGNRAAKQFQLDVLGEVMDCLHQARQYQRARHPHMWEIECRLLEYLQKHWRDPDHGIWETRGAPEHFTHSKVMAWVAVDRAIRSAQDFELPAPLDAWKKLRAEIHADVCQRGFDPTRGSFMRAYGSEHLDASLLMIPLVGFLPAKDPRVVGTVKAVEETLLHDGFVHRYDTRASSDGLPPGEGVFLACSFWLADNYLMVGRRDDAERLFERLLGLANDVGLLAEQYDPDARRLVGNFPQAFSHVALLDTAFDLYRRGARAAPRSRA